MWYSVAEFQYQWFVWRPLDSYQWWFLSVSQAKIVALYIWSKQPPETKKHVEKFLWTLLKFQIMADLPVYMQSMIPRTFSMVLVLLVCPIRTPLMALVEQVNSEISPYLWRQVDSRSNPYLILTRTIMTDKIRSKLNAVANKSHHHPLKSPWCY